MESAGPYASLHLARTDKHASIPPLSFFTGRLSFLLPNRQRQSTEGRVSLLIGYLIEIWCVVCESAIANQLGAAGHWGNGRRYEGSGYGTDWLRSSAAERFVFQDGHRCIYCTPICWLFSLLDMADHQVLRCFSQCFSIWLTFAVHLWSRFSL